MFQVHRLVVMQGGGEGWLVSLGIFGSLGISGGRLGCLGECPVGGLGFRMGALQKADMPVHSAVYCWSLLEGTICNFTSAHVLEIAVFCYLTGTLVI